MGSIIDETGKRYGFLTVLSRADSVGGRAMWKCKCDCGNEKVVPGKHLREGLVRSCGHLRYEGKTFTHGMSKTRLYAIWSGMRTRCTDENRKSYRDYGSRGITVCDDWSSFEPFMEWALSNGYSGDLTIERINVDLGYFPGNCKWIPRGDQNKNTRRNVFLTVDGETKILSDWARTYGIDAGRIYSRLSNGWSAEKAVKTPIRKCVRRGKCTTKSGSN